MTDEEINVGLLASWGGGGRTHNLGELEGGAGGRGGSQERANYCHNPKSVRGHLVQNISHVPIRENKTTRAMQFLQMTDLNELFRIHSQNVSTVHPTEEGLFLIYYDTHIRVRD